MIKIIIINHTFQKPEFYKRWKIFSDMHNDLDVTLLAPEEWEWGKEKTLTYGHIDNIKGTIIEDTRFRIHLIDTKRDKLGEWTSEKLKIEIINIKPNIVYFIGGHIAAPLMQIIDLKNKYNLNNMKIIAFSMRGHTPTIDFKANEKGIKKYINYIAKKLIFSPRIKKCNKYCDALFCHYPIAMKAFRDEGYKKPIYIQTQVGVDPDIFGPNEKSRERIRNKYNIGNSFVFGSASRFHYSKGLLEIIKALPNEGNWKYMMMGWGREEEVKAIKNEIKKRRLEERIILTGYIDKWEDMAEHWNALDCAIHTPLTTLRWEETFSLALVQAMITGLPVIGSNSGSVPYQIGPKGIIVEEGNVNELRRKMILLMNDKVLCKENGIAMRERALKSFNIYHLNELFYLTIKDILSDIYDIEKVNMAEYSI